MTDETVVPEAPIEDNPETSESEKFADLRTTRRQRWIAAALLGAGTLAGLTLAALAGRDSDSEEIEDVEMDFESADPIDD